jgi:hypothetical protein
MVRRVLLSLALVVVGTLGAAACSVSVTDGHDGLSYSVVPHAGGVTASLSDERGDKRTVWLIVSDSSGRQLGVLTSHGIGDAAPDVSDVASADISLDPGTYRYAVYDAAGVRAAHASAYWTPEYEVASGDVKVE